MKFQSINTDVFLFVPFNFLVLFCCFQSIIFFAFLHWLLLVCRNTTDFCVLISYSATLLNLFISFQGFVSVCVVFIIGLYCLQTDYFTSSFPISMSFISFSCLNTSHGHGKIKWNDACQLLRTLINCLTNVSSFTCSILSFNNHSFNIYFCQSLDKLLGIQS